jgi:NAD(P)-dependent dehydrogenase (short-subunit alcohol dehydrogenase family)
MTKYFSVHLAKKKIRVNSVSPGGIYNIKDPQSKTFIKNYSRRNPMNRMADVYEIVGAIVYLTSDTSSYTTGHNLIVDGGMSAW